MRVTDRKKRRETNVILTLGSLLQEDGVGKGKTSTGSHRLATLCAVVLPLQSLPIQWRKRLIQAVGLTLARTQYEHRGQLFSVSTFRRAAEVGNMAVCEGLPFTPVSCFCRGLVL